MRTSLKTLIAASTLVAGIAAAPALYADSPKETPGAQISPMTHGNMMGQGNTMDMQKMMGQMMKAHNIMMQTMMDTHSTAPSGTAPSDSAPSDKE
jgi:hypothetical protein